MINEDELEYFSNKIDDKLSRLSLLNKDIERIFKLTEKGVSKELVMKLAVAYLAEKLELAENFNESLIKVIDESNII